jgi:molybdopterin molybdotransferase
VRLKGFRKLTPVEEALETFLEKIQIKKPRIVIIHLSQALNRVLAEQIVAEEDLPRFDKSAVDGYAVKAEDTFGSSQSKPKNLRITNKSGIGEKEAKKIWTGNLLPKDANAVVMLENTKQTDNNVEMWASLTPGENVSKRGEDIRKGEIAVRSGTRLKPQHLGLIAAQGIARVKVFEKPKIAILATGNELIEVGNKPLDNQIFDTNRIIISSLCRELDAEPMDLGIAKDDGDEIHERLKTGLNIADAIITTGGTSVGISDLVPEAVDKIGEPGVIVHGVAMRPAMPTALAVANEKPIIILSGNPVAAIIGFEVFARPLICRLLGLKQQEHRPVVKAKMTKKTTSALGRKTFVRVHVFQQNEEFLAEPVSARGSGLISTMTKANGYVVVPENREGIAENDVVSVHLFDNVDLGPPNV